MRENLNIETQKNILIETIKEYPAYYRDKLLIRLKKKNLICNNKRSKNEKKLLDVSNINDSIKKLEHIIENLDTAITEIQEFEYERAYRYCTMFKVLNYSDSLLFTSEKNGQVTKSENNDYLSVNGIYPTYKIEDNQTLLKFNFIQTSKDNNTKSIKYPVLAIIYKDLDILEIRFDTIPFHYKNNELFYSNLIGAVKAWILSILNIGITEAEKSVKLECIDFKPIVKYMSDEKKEEVTIIALKMRRNGMLAYLDASTNEELTIPILGELKELIDNNDTLLDKSPEVKCLLSNFVRKIEETSDLPSVKILWHEKNVKVLLTHNYQGNEYTLFKYYDELNDKGVMNYVTKYFVDCKNENDKLFED